MFSRPWSVLCFVLCVNGILACSHVQANDVAKDKASDKTLVDDKYSLKADRKAFDELRQQIPEEKRSDNDERAFMDNLMSDLSKTPADVRNKFSSMVNKKRELFQKDMTKRREEFNKGQQKARDAFSKDQTEQRRIFSKQKNSSEERRDFFGELDGKRKDFYADQKEKRDEFEADIREKRKDFDDYMREKNSEFNERHRDYSKRYDENKKAIAAQKKQAEEDRKNRSKRIEMEYQDINNKPVTPLQSGDGDGE